jgi:hypothetical protein
MLVSGGGQEKMIYQVWNNQQAENGRGGLKLEQLLAAPTYKEAKNRCVLLQKELASNYERVNAEQASYDAGMVQPTISSHSMLQQDMPADSSKGKGKGGKGGKSGKVPKRGKKAQTGAVSTPRSDRTDQSADDLSIPIQASVVWSTFIKENMLGTADRRALNGAILTVISDVLLVVCVVWFFVPYRSVNAISTLTPHPNHLCSQLPHPNPTTAQLAHPNSPPCKHITLPSLKVKATQPLI